MLFVALEVDMDRDKVLELCKAIEQLRGVLKAELNVVNCGDWLAEKRVRHELRQKLWEVVK
jgi:hypothetical protein